jgi:hypothetical protein
VFDKATVSSLGAHIDLVLGLGGEQTDLIAVGDEEYVEGDL